MSRIPIDSFDFESGDQGKCNTVSEADDETGCGWGGVPVTYTRRPAPCSSLVCS